jgi:hypothetical protein
MGAFGSKTRKRTVAWSNSKSILQHFSREPNRAFYGMKVGVANFFFLFSIKLFARLQRRIFAEVLEIYRP